MMNENIEKLALKATLLNYVDNETPRRCFISGNADIEEVGEFDEETERGEKGINCLDLRL